MQGPKKESIVWGNKNFNIKSLTALPDLLLLPLLHRFQQRQEFGRRFLEGEEKKKKLSKSLRSGEVWKSIFKITIALIWFGSQVVLDSSIRVNRRCEIFIFIKWEPYKWLKCTGLVKALWTIFFFRSFWRISFAVSVWCLSLMLTSTFWLSGFGTSTKLEGPRSHPVQNCPWVT